MVVSKSTNGGNTWSRYTLTSAGYTFALVVDPSNSNIVYAGGSPGVYKTTNGGSSWSLASTGISDTVFDLGVDPQNTSVLYAGTPSGVFKTTNGGASWSNTGCTGIRALVVDPDDPNKIYAGGDDGVYVTTNGGSNWTDMSDGLPSTVVTSLGINPGQYLFCGTEDAAMFRWPFTPLVGEGVERRLGILKVTPNPTTGRITIQYQLGNESQVDLAIYDAQGRLISRLVSKIQGPGSYSHSWHGLGVNGKVVPAGVYFCRLSAEEEVFARKFVLLR
ncbi:MAG TPA: T9SS type A sorting domain-containing protein [bacterium (Candidatus Stahlbacteria)]|nr:T9SS type A sorting domain-containing protein [Candidatus Stahlbacteria bacterium]